MRHNGLYSLTLALLIACTVPALAQEISADLKSPANENRGRIQVTPADMGSLVRVEVSGIPEGWHAVHFHQKGVCDGDAKFESAGSHASMDGQVHGELAEGETHAGDLPNLWVGADGNGKAEFFTHTKADNLTDADGSAFIVHAKADDYKTQPSGNAGDRIACGILKTQ